MPREDILSISAFEGVQLAVSQFPNLSAKLVN